jgi:G6PDH family F420-dependent oxidoreductase
MIKVGYFLSCEEFGPLELLRQGRMAEEAGFGGLWISDHYHPWVEAQGESPFVWSVIGGLSQVTQRIPVYTAVTCPTVRIHPAILAQATATSATMLPGRFGFGVGSGEALNEHIFGDAWPSTDVRLEMLEEAIGVIRLLWEGGAKDHDGRYYMIENARIYTLPDEPPPILVSGFGPKSIRLAGQIGDGYMNVAPDGEMLSLFRSSGGGDKPAHGAFKVCYGQDRDECVRTAHRTWPNEGLPGELAQVLPTPTHFEQAVELVTEDMISDSIPCGPDPEQHREMIRQFEKAGYDEVYVQQIGTGHEEFFRLYHEEILPEFH